MLLPKTHKICLYAGYSATNAKIVDAQFTFTKRRGVHSALRELTIASLDLKGKPRHTAEVWVWFTAL